MMLTHKFVRLIHEHSEALANGLLDKVQRSSRARAYANVPPSELRQRVYEIYHHLGEWLLGKKDANVEARYMAIGDRRARQGVPLSQLIWAIVLTKDNLWEFILSRSFSAIEIFAQTEFLQLLEQFFDRATYAAALGYEAAEKGAITTQKAG